MRKSDVWYLSPTRQSGLAILLIIYRVIKAIVRGWWPLIVVFFVRSDRWDKSLIIYGLTALGALIIISSILSYLRFFFYLDGSQLHVERGVLRKTRLDIPFDRIQSIALEQPLIHRLFGVCKVNIDTAGSKGNEFSFTALAVERAEVLKSILQSKIAKRGIASEEVMLGQQPTRNLLLQLDVKDLLKIGVSQNHIRTAGIIIFFIFSLGEQIEEAIGERFTSQLERVGEIIFSNALVMGVAIGIGVLLAAFFGTLVRTVLQYFDLKLWKQADGYRVNSGLFNKRERVVAHNKIQFLRWDSNPIKKYFGIVALRFYQASSDVMGRGRAITVPGCNYAQLEQINGEYFGATSRQAQFSMAVSRRLFYRRWFFLGCLPALGFFVLFVISWYFIYFFVAVFWLLGSYWYQDTYQRTWSAWINRDLLFLRHGVLEVSNRMMQHFKIQGTRISTSPYLRRRGLANLHFFTASGELKVPYIPMQQALDVKNYLNYKVESATRPWM